MSQKDLETSQRDLRTLVGRKCFVLAQANSLKVQLDHDEPDAPHIWIDPPWTLSNGGTIRAEASGCPHFSDPEYEQKFAAWCATFARLRRSRFEGFAAEDDGSITFQFEDGFELLVPLDPAFEPDPFGRYDHWYARA